MLEFVLNAVLGELLIAAGVLRLRLALIASAALCSAVAAGLLRVLVDPELSTSEPPDLSQIANNHARM